LIGYLALHSAEPQPRQRLAFLIWPDSSESQAYTNLRTVLHRLQSSLPDVAQLLNLETQVVGWQPSVQIQLDVADFKHAMEQAYSALEDGDRLSARHAFETAVSIYNGDLLADFYDEWVLSEREQLRILHLDALEQLVTLLEQSLNYVAAIAYARRLILLDPLNEELYVRLINLQVLNGERAAALRTYHSCVSILRDELNAKPSKALTATYEKLLTTHLPSAKSINNTPFDSPTMLIGRNREWQQMQAIFEIVTANRPRMLVISGEAGIGKTRLATEFIRWANQKGMVSAIAPCYAAEGDLAFAPVALLLRSDSLQDGMRRLDAQWLSEIARITPDIIKQNPRLVPHGPLTEQWQRQRFFEALARAVLASERPTVIFIDDLQWSARDTLEWLHYLLRFETQTRLLVVGTIREEEVINNQALKELLVQLRSEARMDEIVLNPLDPQNTSALAASILGNPLSEEQSDSLFNETEGNPLFVLETLRDLGASALHQLTEGVKKRRDNVLPPKVQAIVERRIGHLSPQTRQVLEIASVIGRSFTFEVLSNAAGLDEDVLLSSLDELWQRCILREQGEDAYDFTHDKIRAVTYSSLRLAQRKVFHRRIAQALENIYQNELGAKSGQIAAHYEEAGLLIKAADYYQNAAQYARGLYANDIALSNLQNAVRVLDSSSQQKQSAVYDQIGDLLLLLGHYSEALDAWHQALDTNPNADSVNRAHLYRKLGNVQRDQNHHDEALSLYDTAETLLDDNDNSDLKWLCWAQINLERMSTFYWLGDAEKIFQLIDQVRPILEEWGSLAQRAKLHHVMIMALLRRDRYLTGKETLDHARAYLEMTIRANDIASIPFARFQLGGALQWQSPNLDDAVDEYNQALELAEKSGDVSLLYRCLSYMTVTLRRQQKLDQVRIFAKRSLELASAHQMSNYVGAAYANLAWLEWKSNNLRLARQYATHALDIWQKDSYPARYAFEWLARLPLIAIALTENNISEAHSHVHILLHESQQRMPSDIETPLQQADKADGLANANAIKNLLSIAIQKSVELKYL
jgi:DNA-binding SARP family transcriptional activator